MTSPTKPVAVVGIISRTNLRGDIEYLLVKSKTRHTQYTGCWQPPGGHIEAGEAEDSALIREIKEELGMDVRPVRKIAQVPGDVIPSVGYWQCEAVSAVTALQKEEIDEYGYFTLGQMKTLRLWPTTEQFFKNHILFSR